MNEDLHLKYRPKDFDEVIGQELVINSLKSLQNNFPHAILFTGPSGSGKTSLSRIIADKVGAIKNNIIEVDAATNNGIDDVRSLQEGLQFGGFGESKIKVVIMDESHSCSKAAWQALLKVVEEPPKHVYWIFCTTEIDKVPETIKTRCNTFNLRDVSTNELFEYLQVIGEIEEFNLLEDIYYKIAEAAMGSPRRALTLLSKCRACKTVKEAIQLLEVPDDTDEDTIQLCKALIRGTDMSEIIQLLNKMEVKSAESVRLMILAYFSKVILNPKSSSKLESYFAILNAFKTPYYQAEKLAPLLLSFGELLL